MVDTGIPGSPAPYSQARGDHYVGVRYGNQQKAIWMVGESDERPMCDLMLAAALWRVTVWGSRVRVRIQYGTSATKEITNLDTPIRLALPGQVIVYAKPIPNDQGLFIGAHCEVTATAATSGCCEGEARYLIGGAQAIPDDAVRFRAINAAVVNLGLGAAPCTLAATQVIPLVAGSALVSVDGYLEFDT